MLYLEHLLAPLGVDLVAQQNRVKLARHQDSRIDVADLYRQGEFETYQAFQSKPVFGNCDLLVSFLGRSSTEAVFVGLYAVGTVTEPGAKFPPDNVVDGSTDVSSYVHYTLTRDERFDELRSAIGVAAVINCIYTEKNVSGLNHFRPGKRVSQENRVARWDVRDWNAVRDFCFRSFPRYIDIVNKRRTAEDTQVDLCDAMFRCA